MNELELLPFVISWTAERVEIFYATPLSDWDR